MARDYEIPPQSIYVSSLYADETPEMRHVRSTINDQKLNSIQITAEEGKIIYTLLNMINAKRVLEIGTLAGYSTMWIAKALHDITNRINRINEVYSNNEIYVVSCEKNKERYELASNNISNSSFKQFVKLKFGPFLDIAEEIYSELESKSTNSKFDAVFIDGMKSEYVKYLQSVLPHIRSGGLIIADNTFLFGQVYNNTENNEATKVMREFNNMLSDQTSFISTILPTAEGLSIAIKL